MCYYLFHRKSMTALEKNPKKYIEEHFCWLQESGYRLTYSFRNGENEFWYDNSCSSVYIFYDDFDTVFCEISFCKPRHTHRITDYFDDDVREYYKRLSPKGKIDFLSDKLKDVLETSNTST